jgi:hypothetical protein
MILHDFGKRMISMNENEKEWSAWFWKKNDPGLGIGLGYRVLRQWTTKTAKLWIGIEFHSKVKSKFTRTWHGKPTNRQNNDYCYLPVVAIIVTICQFFSTIINNWTPPFWTNIFRCPPFSVKNTSWPTPFCASPPPVINNEWSLI